MPEPRLVLLSRGSAIALRALVELAREPALTLSVAELARRQRLPQPMLEQILLRLRREGLLEARRGRHGGYRLAVPADTLPLARVLAAVRSTPPAPENGWSEAHKRSAEASRDRSVAGSETGSHGEADSDSDSLGASAGHRVEQQLRRRLEGLVRQELQRLTLAELLYDQRSWEASLGPEGGLMLS